MAEINGVSLKGIKLFEDAYQYHSRYQASIWLDGKKVGWYEQSKETNKSKICIDNKKQRDEVYARCHKYLEKKNDESYWLASEDELAYIKSVEGFFDDFVQFELLSRKYKRAKRAGFAGVASVAQNFWVNGPDTNIDTRCYMSRKEAEDDLIEEIHDKSRKVMMLFSSEEEIICTL